MRCLTYSNIFIDTAMMTWFVVNHFCYSRIKKWHFFLVNWLKYKCSQYLASVYLSNLARIEVQSLPQHALHAVLGPQLDLGGVRLLLHEVKKRLHLPPGEGQHRVQVIHHPVWWREGKREDGREVKKGENCEKLADSYSSARPKQPQYVLPVKA